MIQNRRILLIDDEVIALKECLDSLRDEKTNAPLCRISVLSDQSAGLELLKSAVSDPFHIVFINMDMSNGIPGLIREIQKNFPELRIVLSSAKSFPGWHEFVTENPSSGSIVLLRRPIAADELIQTFANLSDSSFDTSAADSVFKEAGLLEKLFNALPFSIIAVDETGVARSWNTLAEKFMTGDISGHASVKIWDWLSFLIPDEARFKELIQSSNPFELKDLEYGAGEGLYLNVFINPVMSEGQSSLLIMITDVTVDHKKDEYLRQAQKMDTVGNLASGIAHDFNNVLGAIAAMFSSVKFSVQSARDLDRLKEDIKSDMEIIEDAIKHGSDTVDQLRVIARKKELALSRINIRDTIDKVMKICRSTFPKTINVNISFYHDAPAFVMAYPSQMEQLLLNLCVNASHAMTIMRKDSEKQGGDLTVSLEKVMSGKQFSSVLPDAHEGEYFLLRIWDTGVGMSQEILKKIFDPFFTTKEKKGTGLGLSMVYNIVRQHKGFIEVYSEPGNGSVFNIFLPAATEETPELPPNAP